MSTFFLFLHQTKPGRSGREHSEEDEVKEAALHSGFAEILQDRVTIMAEVVEWPSEIDVARAEEALKRAEDRISGKDQTTDIVRAEAALHRAMARIEVVK